MSLENHKVKFTGERMVPKLNIGAAFYYEHLIRYLFAAKFSNNKTVLDAGCGTGYGSYILSSYGPAKKIIGIDVSDESLRYAKKNYIQKNIIFKKDDIRHLKSISYSSINLVVSFEVIEHINEQVAFLKQIKRVLVPDGIFIVSTPNTLTYPKGNKFHKKELTMFEFERILQSKFKYVKIFSQKFYLNAELTSLDSDSKKRIFKFNSKRYQEELVLNYKAKPKFENAEYFLAVCSDFPIPAQNNISFSLNNVDGLNFENGMISFNKQLKKISLGQAINQDYLFLKNFYNEITDSKFYSFWRLYSYLKEQFKKLTRST